MRRVDKLGRIVIPRNLREKYGLSEGVGIEFIDAGEGIIVKASEPICRICKGEISLNSKFPLCDECIRRIVSERK